MNPRSALRWALLVAWLGVLAALRTGDTSCYDPASGGAGIDALGHCTTDSPLGLPISVSDDFIYAWLLGGPVILALAWWPARPWRKTDA